MLEKTGSKQVYKDLVRFSICACHPCAGAMPLSLALYILGLVAKLSPPKLSPNTRTSSLKRTLGSKPNRQGLSAMLNFLVDEGLR